ITLTPANFQLNGLVGSDTFAITQTAGDYDSKDTHAVSVNVSLSPSDFIASAGTPSNDYSLPVTSRGSGAILAKTLTAAIIGNPTKTYDGTTAVKLTAGNFQLSGLALGQNLIVTQMAGAYNSQHTNAVTISANLSTSDLIAIAGTLASDYT